MSLFEALYGRKCITLINWDGPINIVIIGPKILKEMENHVVKINQSLKVSQDKRKSYANLKRTCKEFKVEDHIYLRVKLKRSSLNLGSCAKLAPILCGSFEVLDRNSLVVYRVALPTNMKSHNIFHVSLLKI